MAEQSLGEANPGPYQGPLVITEIMYHPLDLDQDGELVSSDFEYVEIFNTSTSAIALDEWVLAGGIDFEFATGTNLGRR